MNTDSNGNESVTYVPTGTHSGLSYCGADGEWHFGWLVDAVKAPTSGGKAPVKVGADSPVLSAAR